MMTPRENGADPITTEVVRHALETIAEEMGTALRRTALSVVVKDMRDYSCALFDARGRMLAAALDIPSLLASMAPALRACLDKWGEDIHPGDVFINNHPYLGACQTNDINIFVPVFDAAATLVGFTGVIAHHADWGGRTPGTAAARSESAYEEGVLLPALKVEVKGVPERGLLDIITANTRHPAQNHGDLRAQIAAARSGAGRFAGLAGKFGTGLLLDTFEELFAYTVRRTRAEIAKLPDGDYTAEGCLDNDGLDLDAPVRIVVKAVISGEEIHFDFTGSDPQMRGGMNIPDSTLRSVVHYAVKCLMPSDVPFNEGSLDPVSFHAPRGTAVNPEFPAAVGDRHLASQRLASIVTRALAAAAPHRASAEWFVGWPVLICESRSPKSGDGVVLLANVAGGAGACVDHDGADALDVHMANCQLIPAEVIESSYELRVERYALIPDSGGAGRHRGGLGIRADYRNISSKPLGFLSEAEQTRPEFAPQGLTGGRPGMPASLALIHEDGTETALPSKGQGSALPGEIVSLRAGGGGGYGDPAERPAELVEADLRDGRITAAGAAAYERTR
ncbi:hydantoinase B/oxoprolinase family protein [Nonomuraea sp. C10]|uniref:hydantoinase B/oxoprolinase family protein n=1 Tax=Nonomuraea sp. C10 TaxID=2600577 RepID=UPI0011CDBF6B|nr:hydantoinase B/oxoprolinase family protein [Nonomuraea sp. C10]TXK42096.1 hydantoinase B/oxoprolinase family protein [Nonomuraea sp. C10]